LISPPIEDNDGKLGLFIIMEYFESDLKQVLSSSANKDDFTLEHTIQVAYNILCAIKFLHSANVLHRDLKPGNILLDEDCNIRICDFGLSRTLPESCIGKGSGNSKRMRDSILKANLHNITDEKELNDVIA
jgi:serine/threonine protein kinase